MRSFRPRFRVDLPISEKDWITGRPLASKPSQSEAKDPMVITLRKNPQNDGWDPASKTQVTEWPKALLISWIEPFFRWWCALAGNSWTVRPWCLSKSIGGSVLSVEWCGWSLSSLRPSCGTSEWVFHHWVALQQNPQTVCSRAITSKYQNREWIIGAPQPSIYTFPSISLLS